MNLQNLVDSINKFNAKNKRQRILKLNELKVDKKTYASDGHKFNIDYGSYQGVSLKKEDLILIGFSDTSAPPFSIYKTVKSSNAYSILVKPERYESLKDKTTLGIDDDYYLVITSVCYQIEDIPPLKVK